MKIYEFSFKFHFHVVNNIYSWKNDIYISFFHTNRDYLQLVHSKIIQIRSKFDYLGKLLFFLYLAD